MGQSHLLFFLRGNFTSKNLTNNIQTNIMLYFVQFMRSELLLGRGVIDVKTLGTGLLLYLIVAVSCVKCSIIIIGLIC